MAILLLMPLVLKLMHRSEETLLIVEDDKDQKEKAAGMIVIGYSADPYGRAALEHGIAEAKLRQTTLLVINATSGESYADPRFAQSGEVHDVEE